jgi:1-hydroxycarotenoid 3,4-desaturase
MADPRVIVIGAGIGGLVAALLLAKNGCAVTLVEALASPGGKMREVCVGSERMDAGPTVFTMLSVFEEIFQEAGENLHDHIRLKPVSVLARHAWEGQHQPELLDLYASRDESEEAIARFSSSDEGRRYRAFCREAARIHDTLERTFMRVERPSQWGLVRKAGFRKMLATRPFTSMWTALSQHFSDPRLRQLFGRYATYCGSSPYLSPATLMLVAHVEQEGVWLVEGGMHKLAQALAKLVQSKGGIIHYGVAVRRILTNGSQATGVELADGRHLSADAIVMNGDAHALADGLMGEDVRRSVPRTAETSRSLSAITWNALAKPTGFQLARHSVFFSRDYRQEFNALSRLRRMPEEPTVYVCAQDRDDTGQCSTSGPERMLILINAPANGDTTPYRSEEIERCQQGMMRKLAACGLQITELHPDTQVTTPVDFARLFPATGGALYGRATHGSMASFARPGARSAIKGLYLAGGSVHPGPGVPMVALSGQIAARCLLRDWTLQHPSHRVATPGGMSTP